MSIVPYCIEKAHMQQWRLRAVKNKQKGSIQKWKEFMAILKPTISGDIFCQEA